MITIDICEYATALGAMTGAMHDGKLVGLAFSDRWPEIEARLRRRFGAFERRTGDAALLQARLDAYFAGDLAALDDIVVDPGGTEFQRAVWTSLHRVRSGRTTTHGALAREIGSPSAVRAVGAANGANPIWLVIPCHRANGANGDLTGYAGGLDRKRWLLRHEEGAAVEVLAVDGLRLVVVHTNAPAIVASHSARWPPKEYHSAPRCPPAHSSCAQCSRS